MNASGEQETTNAELLENVEEQGERWDFFLLVRQLAGLLGHCDTVAVGALGPVARETVRFRNEPSLGFPTSDISKVRLPQPGAPHAVVTSTFLGLTGTVSPLPPHMVEEAARASFDGDADFLAFYDFFHHRTMALLYRAWEQPRLAATHLSDRSDAGSGVVQALVGVVSSQAGVASAGAPDPADLLLLAPLASRRTKSHRSLLASLRRLFPQVHIDTEPFVERHVPLAMGQRMCLGVRNSTLAGDITIGASLRDRGGRFRLVIGPVSSEEHADFSPGGASFARLRALVGHFTGGLLECEVELSLLPSAVPRLALGKRGSAELGRTTRLSSEVHDAPVSRFLLDGAAAVRATLEAS